ncbi:cAMP-responsive element modulator isoform X2 [Xiphias gladius]|uniref:cAMP-responsive element modulator isoform X2 n=1 Tax=Xiphias gladius TaxID=8245 RepID=UPI001A97EA50|nr:cAMP-responsive element modulator isoform X2 [Xiphias gladius]XP_039999165.1 cAMP-responsive element modulator isoform X2 [Xiphias gladius]
MVRQCRSKGSSRPLRPLSYSHHKSRLSRLLLWQSWRTASQSQTLGRDERFSPGVHLIVPRIDEEKAEEEVPVSSAASASVPTSIYQTSSGQYIAVTQGRAVQLTSPGVEALQGAQTPTVASSPTPQPGTTVVQCAAQPGDSPQQFYIQGGQVFIQAATGDIPAYQLRSPNSGLAQSIVMAASPGSIQSPSSQHAEEITRKREVRLMKNREAARECRRKKKEYVKCLENRVAVLENQNKTLIEELKALKDIYCHKAE